jgi:glyoxylase-like metal-dependent hydrolase (beta-lactamase superfamily II)
MDIEVVHTTACVTYIVGDAALVRDTLFMPDYGTARTDFLRDDATTLYRSIKNILSRPAATQLYICHDYAPNGFEHAWQTTVAAQRKDNVYVHDDVSEDGLVKMRTQRDLESDVLAFHPCFGRCFIVRHING